MKAFDFLKRQIEIARVYGIPVRVDYRWFFVFAASVWLIAPAFMSATRFYAQTGTGAAIVLSFVTSAMLFLSIFGHELAHALAARYEGIDTLEIVLHPFGGLARLGHAPETAGAEFRIAIAGPAASFLFSIIAAGVWFVVRAGGFRTTAAVFFILGLWNLLVAFFNLLPGYPLDGGRVLRAGLWQATGNLAEATRVSSLGGQLLAWSLMVTGGYAAFYLQLWAVGLWTIVVGFFLRDAAASVMRESGFLSSGGRTVADVMRPPLSIEPETLVSTFVDSILPAQRRTAIPVARGGSLHGILTLEDLRRVPREAWHKTLARDVMRPVAEGLFVPPSTQLAVAEELMRRNGAGALGVVDGGGRLVGFLQSTLTKK
ncbi:MAG: site-2 protease family protein [Pyrinomonadaceae bacterium MAG19_C2-C3]|nr:site-2 protease family protein [Pyrinomonadaceae bacterium MAG19_C2-C3]